MTWKRFLSAPRPPRRVRRRTRSLPAERNRRKHRSAGCLLTKRAAPLTSSWETSQTSSATLASRTASALLETLWQDVRYGIRMLLKHRGFALVSLLTLALGIGANTAIFTVVDATLIRPLPFPNANRIVMVWEHRLPDGERQNVTSPATFLDWQRDNTVFDQMAAIFNDSSILSGGDTPEQIATASVSPNFLLDPGSECRASAGSLCPRRMAMRRFEPRRRPELRSMATRILDPTRMCLATQITLDDKPYTVVGVMPRGFQFFVKQQSFSQKKPEIWVTMNFSAELAPVMADSCRQSGCCDMV